MIKFKPAWTAILTGGIFGILFALLIKFGNPANMGACLLCFYRDISGALGLHKIENLAYLRPEILGFILGAFIASLFSREFAPQGGSSPILRFVISAIVALGGLVFLGCPTRMMGRLAGGDPTALVGLSGFIVGILIGIWFLRKGFTLGRSETTSRINGWIIPAFGVLLLFFLILKPAYITLNPRGHAPLFISLIAGLVIGALAQRSRFCFMGGLKNVVMMADFRLFQGLISFLLFCFIMNLVFGQFTPGAHPIAHTNHPANFMGMLVVGLGSTMIGGCPFRQTILAGQGNTGSGFSVLGMVAGGALAHNFLIAGTPSGISSNSFPALILGLIIFFVIAFTNRKGPEQL